MSGPWRVPDEESTDLYPGLVVHDGRQSGSITLGRTRLPITSATPYLAEGWETFCGDYDEPGAADICGFTRRDAALFLGRLLDHRGEFARLLLVLADVERIEEDREVAHFAEHAPGEELVRMDIGDGSGGCPFPLSWWEMPDQVQRVVAQLRRCFEALGADLEEAA